MNKLSALSKYVLINIKISSLYETKIYKKICKNYKKYENLRYHPPL